MSHFILPVPNNGIILGIHLDLFACFLVVARLESIQCYSC